VEDDANEQFVLHVEFMTRVARNMGERIFGYVQRIFPKVQKAGSKAWRSSQPRAPGTSVRKSTWSRCRRCSAGSASVKTWYLPWLGDCSKNFSSTSALPRTPRPFQSAITRDIG